MIQRILLGQSRAFCAQSLYIPTASPIRSQIPTLRIRSLQERIGARYYFSTDTPKDGASLDGAAVEAPQSEIEDSDPIQKDVELKNREIIDLKVRPKLRKSQCHLFL